LSSRRTSSSAESLHHQALQAMAAQRLQEFLGHPRRRYDSARP